MPRTQLKVNLTWRKLRKRLILQSVNFKLSLKKKKEIARTLKSFLNVIKRRPTDSNLQSRTEKEIRELQAKLEDSEDARAALQTAQAAYANELQNLRNQARGDYEGKIEKLEESKRALMSAHKLAVQELQEKLSDLENVEKQRKAEIEDLKSRLEAEIVSKGEEAVARKSFLPKSRSYNLRLRPKLQNQMT